MYMFAQPNNGVVPVKKRNWQPNDPEEDYVDPKNGIASRATYTRPDYTTISRGFAQKQGESRTDYLIRKQKAGFPLSPAEMSELEYYQTNPLSHTY